MTRHKHILVQIVFFDNQKLALLTADKISKDYIEMVHLN